MRNSYWRSHASTHIGRLCGLELWSRVPLNFLHPIGKKPCRPEFRLSCSMLDAAHQIFLKKGRNTFFWAVLFPNVSFRVVYMGALFRIAIQRFFSVAASADECFRWRQSTIRRSHLIGRIKTNSEKGNAPHRQNDTTRQASDGDGLQRHRLGTSAR